MKYIQWIVSAFCILGAVHAKLVAQKSKGMPRISISLTKLVDSAANEAMANLSLELFKAFKNVRYSLVEGCVLYPYVELLLHYHLLPKLLSSCGSSRCYIHKEYIV